MVFHWDKPGYDAVGEVSLNKFMAIPDYQTLMLPLLRFTGDGAERPFREAVDRLAEEFANWRISTSNYSREALEYVNFIATKIILIDGDSFLCLARFGYG